MSSNFFAKYICFSFVFCSALFVSAQQETNKDASKAYFPLGIGLSFNSNNLHTGVRLCAEQILQINQHNKLRGDTIYKTRNGIKFLNYNAQFNHDNKFNKSLQIGVDYGMRRVKKKGRTKELIFGTGLTKTFLLYQTFNVNANGSIIEKKIPGNMYGYFTSMIGFGKDYFYTKKQLPIKWHIRLGSTLLFPYGSFVLPYFTADIGLVYRLKQKPIQLKKGFNIKNKTRK